MTEICKIVSPSVEDSRTGEYLDNTHEDVRQALLRRASDFSAFDSDEAGFERKRFKMNATDISLLGCPATPPRIALPNGLSFHVIPDVITSMKEYCDRYDRDDTEDIETEEDKYYKERLPSWCLWMEELDILMMPSEQILTRKILYSITQLRQRVLPKMCQLKSTGGTSEILVLANPSKDQQTGDCAGLFQIKINFKDDAVVTPIPVQVYFPSNSIDSIEAATHLQTELQNGLQGMLHLNDQPEMDFATMEAAQYPPTEFDMGMAIFWQILHLNYFDTPSKKVMSAFAAKNLSTYLFRFMNLVMVSGNRVSEE